MTLIREKARVNVKFLSDEPNRTNTDKPPGIKLSPRPNYLKTVENGKLKGHIFNFAIFQARGAI